MEKTNLNSEQETYLAKWMGGELSDSELAQYIPEAEINFYRKLRLGSDLLNDPGEETFMAIQGKIGEKSKVRSFGKRNIRWAMAVASSLLLFLASYFYFEDGSTVISTSYAEQKTVTLLDNSEVTINANTQLSYENDNWEERREVRLDGEAYFKVQKGSTFEVVTDNGNVEVLGTQFNVKTTLDYFEVTCYEGKVEVRSNGNAKILLPGMTVRRINGHPTEDGTSTSEQPSWMHGESTFKSVPLVYVLAELENQYSLTFNTDAIDDGIRFTGSFGHDNVKVALAAVFNAMRIAYSYNDQKVIVLHPYE
ncbi:MAG: hypothetical protein Aureis2KO_17570 [Aureisphaera sp.]